jgi:hypothetical protein
MTAARIGTAPFATLDGLTAGGAAARMETFAAGRLLCELRGAVPDFALAGLRALARDAAVLALRIGVLAAFGAAGRRDAAFLVTGFLAFEAFFTCISFSAPG